jgi:hypothetical protein
LHQGIPPAPVAEARGFFWTRDAFTGLLKERSFVRSFICLFLASDFVDCFVQDGVSNPFFGSRIRVLAANIFFSYY